jgi:C_GCAxxG_C_C family probable redox protein
MNRPEKALSLFREGFSCSQAVLTAFAEEMGLARDMALRLSQPFGGGGAKSGDWCGAVTGAFLVLGLKHGRTRAADTAAKDKTYALVQEFMRRFRARNGALRCRDLLGCDIATPEGEKAIESGNLHEKRCEPLVKDAVAILEDIL